jgi:hypothetical protein
MASASVSSDGGATWSTSLSLAVDGIYTILARASDVAGNASTISTTVQIDATRPAVTVSAAGITGLAPWYISPVALSLVPTDAMSGVASTEARVDGGAWQNGTALTLTDGVHTLDVRVTDQAGNVFTETQIYNVDTTAPQTAFLSPAEGSQTTVQG